MSDRTREFATVLEHTRLADTYYRLRLAAPVIAKRCHPGQFVFIRVGEGVQPLLRRPISICDADPQTARWCCCTALWGTVRSCWLEFPAAASWI